MHRDDLRGKLALSNEKTEEEARWVEKMYFALDGFVEVGSIRSYWSS